MLPSMCRNIYLLKQSIYLKELIISNWFKKNHNQTKPNKLLNEYNDRKCHPFNSQAHIVQAHL